MSDLAFGLNLIQVGIYKPDQVTNRAESQTEQINKKETKNETF